LSIALHGSSLMFLGRSAAAPAPQNFTQTAATAPRSNPLEPSVNASEDNSNRMSIDEFRTLLSSGAPVLTVDVRAETSFNSSNYQAQGALHISADQIASRIAEFGVPQQTWIILFCA